MTPDRGDSARLLALPTTGATLRDPVSVGLIFVLGLALVVPAEMTALAAIVGCCAVVSRTDRLAWPPAVRAVAAAFAALVVTTASSVALGAPDAEGIVHLGRLATPFVALTVVVAFAARFDPLAVMTVGSALGASAAGVVGIVQTVVLGDARAEGWAGHAIVFGDVALLLGIVAVAGAMSVPGASGAAGRRRWAGLVGLLGGVAASVASGTRGGWLAVPIVVPLLAVAIGGRRRWRTVPAAVVGVGVFCGLVAFRAFGRLTAIADEVLAYPHGEAGGDATSSSIGGRFEVWRVAMAAFRAEPTTGIGWGHLDDRFDLEAAAGIRSPRIAEFTHAHNQFLDSAANGGLPGLFAFVAILLVPGWLFARELRRRDPRTLATAATGMAVVAAYTVFSTTEAVLHSVVFTVVYGVLVSLAAVALGQVDSPDAAASHSTERVGPVSHGATRRCE